MRRQPGYGFAVPMDYLRSVEYMDLPLRVEGERATDCVRLLQAAGLVMAAIKAAGGDGAIITAITPKGRAALAQYAQGKPFH